MIRWFVVLSVIFTSLTAFPDEKRGGLVLQFDDGWTSWVTLIAPEIQKAGGVATGFVNNQNIRSSRITKEDLLALQNTYHWEIGTHTWHHLNSVAYIKKNGLDQWMNQEFTKSVDELKELGLNVRSLVFPFNVYSPEIANRVAPMVESYRRSEVLALADRPSENKSVPGTAVDMAHYVPPDLVKKWIDLAKEKNTLLFLYGHRVLPDTSFITGIVVAVSATTLTINVPASLPQGGADFVLVPDITRRPVTSDYFHVTKVEGNVVTVDRPDLTVNTKPGALFMIGEAYSTRLSDFREILAYAAQHLNFYTLHDVATRKQP